MNIELINLDIANNYPRLFDEWMLIQDEISIMSKEDAEEEIKFFLKEKGIKGVGGLNESNDSDKNMIKLLHAITPNDVDDRIFKSKIDIEFPKELIDKAQSRDFIMNNKVMGIEQYAISMMGKEFMDLNESADSDKDLIKLLHAITPDNVDDRIFQSKINREFPKELIDKAQSKDFIMNNTVMGIEQYAISKKGKEFLGLNESKFKDPDSLKRHLESLNLFEIEVMAAEMGLDDSGSEEEIKAAILDKYEDNLLNLNESAVKILKNKLINRNVFAAQRLSESRSSKKTVLILGELKENRITNLFESKKTFNSISDLEDAYLPLLDGVDPDEFDGQEERNEESYDLFYKKYGLNFNDEYDRLDETDGAAAGAMANRGNAVGYGELLESRNSKNNHEEFFSSVFSNSNLNSKSTLKSLYVEHLSNGLGINEILETFRVPFLNYQKNLPESMDDWYGKKSVGFDGHKNSFKKVIEDQIKDVEKIISKNLTKAQDLVKSNINGLKDKIGNTSETGNVNGELVNDSSKVNLVYRFDIDIKKSENYNTPYGERFFSTKLGKEIKNEIKVWAKKLNLLVKGYYVFSLKDGVLKFDLTLANTLNMSESKSFKEWNIDPVNPPLNLDVNSKMVGTKSKIRAGDLVGHSDHPNTLFTVKSVDENLVTTKSGSVYMTDYLFKVKSDLSDIDESFTKIYNGTIVSYHTLEEYALIKENQEEFIDFVINTLEIVDPICIFALDDSESKLETVEEINKHFNFNITSFKTPPQKIGNNEVVRVGKIGDVSCVFKMNEGRPINIWLDEEELSKIVKGNLNESKFTQTSNTQGDSGKDVTIKDESGREFYFKIRSQSSSKFDLHPYEGGKIGQVIKENVGIKEGLNYAKKHAKDLSEAALEMGIDSPMQIYADMIVRDQQGKYLLMQRSSESDFEPSKWGFPGGKVMTGETSIEGCIRECKEEVGLDIINPVRVGEYANDEGSISNYFMGEITTQETEYTDDEVQDHAWIDKEELANYPLIYDNIERFYGILVECEKLEAFKYDSDDSLVSHLNEAIAKRNPNGSNIKLTRKSKNSYQFTNLYESFFDREIALIKTVLFESNCTDVVIEEDKDMLNANFGHEISEELYEDNRVTMKKEGEDYFLFDNDGLHLERFDSKEEMDLDIKTNGYNLVKSLDESNSSDRTVTFNSASDADNFMGDIIETGILSTEVEKSEGDRKKLVFKNVSDSDMDKIKEVLETMNVKHNVSDAMNESALDEKIKSLKDNKKTVSGDQNLDKKTKQSELDKIDSELESLQDQKSKESEANILSKIKEQRNRIAEKEEEISRTEDVDVKLKLENQIKAHKEKIKGFEEDISKNLNKAADDATSAIDDFLK